MILEEFPGADILNIIDEHKFDIFPHYSNLIRCLSYMVATAFRNPYIWVGFGLRKAKKKVPPLMDRPLRDIFDKKM